MRLVHFCSLGMVHLLLRAALRDLLWKQLRLFTAKVVTDTLRCRSLAVKSRAT